MCQVLNLELRERTIDFLKQGAILVGRPLRLEFSGALYHATSRGDRQEDIYELDDDRVLFLNVFGEVLAEHLKVMFQHNDCCKQRAKN